MRSFGAAALVAFALVTECIGAHSDRSRQRSGPIRSVPVAADIKRDADFDCPEEFGYYPHPTDCTLYYVCVFGGALLESCTGGLMYSHELQTCDWPRNVGCDGVSAIGGEELERISEREEERERRPPPPPPSPRRTPPPPPPPRAQPQPNPVVTSRGQPKFNREEYEKQQQLYAEVDDLPPVEEIESDRQQRVYRGQPSTIGQVQKDRDGYTQVNSGRTLNSNIIPASISQNNGKIGSFSFGTQVDDRRAATITQAPQTYSLEPTESVAPISYSASPRPKMLYNGTQTYNPDQYDPFYAVYDEDGELYKDTDYVQQYNTASLRPAVQQTYRGTPPPSRRPVDVYTPRPVVSADDYDDALIQGQISNQNQYQSPIRHSTRGDGNELGYDHVPSSVKTTLYEATSISTTPSTTSTSTTTHRTTTAPYTEAMTPSRYTTRSPTDENPLENPDFKPAENPADGSNSSFPSFPSSNINLSSLAKPFEKTDNSNRLSETIHPTERTPTSRLSSRVTNNNEKFVDVVQPSNQDNKKVVSLTSGFSIRRNPNNTNNPYTLTVLTRPIDEYNKSRRRIKVSENINNRESQANRYYYENVNNKESEHIRPKQEPEAVDLSEYDNTSEEITSRKDSSPEITLEDEVPIYIRPTVKVTSRPRFIVTTEPTSTTKYYIKTVVRRPAPFSDNNTPNIDSTENSVNTESVLDSTINSRLSAAPPSSSTNNEENTWKSQDRPDEKWQDPVVSPYRSLSNLRNSFDNQENYEPEPTSSTVSTTRYTTSKPRNLRTEKPRSKPSYYTYRVLDEIVPDQTTEVFSGKVVKNVIKAFLNNLVSTPKPRIFDGFSTTARTTPQAEEKTVNIGFQKKMLKYVDEKPLRSNVQRLQIITEPSLSKFIPSNNEEVSFTEHEFKDFSSTTTSTTLAPSPIPIVITEVPTTPLITESSTNNDFRNVPSRRFYETDFNSFVPSKPDTQKSRKFQKLFNDPPSTEPSGRDSISYVSPDNEYQLSVVPSEATKAPIEIDWDRPTSKLISEIASTTSTTKATMTTKIESTSTTKSLSFPTRASRVNPAIKLAATNPGGGRRSYQTSSKCSSDNSLQANPKCNEIKYQRYKQCSPASSLSLIDFSLLMEGGGFVSKSLLSCLAK